MKKTQPYEDDGHTVYSMEGVESPLRQKKGSVGLSRRERTAAVRAAMAVYMPRLLLVIAGFALAALLIALWLK